VDFKKSKNFFSATLKVTQENNRLNFKDKLPDGAHIAIDTALSY